MASTTSGPDATAQRTAQSSVDPVKDAPSQTTSAEPKDGEDKGEQAKKPVAIICIGMAGSVRMLAAHYLVTPL
jgi:hypothetical protein